MSANTVVGIDAPGMGPNEDPRIRDSLIYESPSRKKHNFTLATLQQELNEEIHDCGASSPDAERFRRKIDQYKDFF